MATANTDRAGQMPHAQMAQADIDNRLRQIIDRALSRGALGVPALALDLDLGVGQTPKELVHARDTARLYRYLPKLDEIYRVPVLLVMSPVAKGYILDLAPGQSFVEYLLECGYDVYLLDWVAPRREHAGLGLADYVCDMTAGAVEQLRSDCGEADVSMIGYCMGGLLACLHACLKPNSGVKNLVCFTTPVNSEGMTLHKRWADSKAFDIDLLVKEFGNIPSEIVNASMQALRPFQRAAASLQLLNNVVDDDFVKATLRFDRWGADQLPIPGELMRDMTRDILRENLLARGELRLRSRRVDLKRIRVPFLHVAAEFDHIVPAAASRDLIDMVGSKDKQEIVIKGGHVSLVAGASARKRLWPQLDRWLAQRSL